MSSLSKVLVMDGGSYYWPHSEFGEFTENTNILKTPEEISLIVFTGGADINPMFYGHEKNPKTSCSEYRDVRDKAAFDLAQKYNIPCVGICRGGQFLTAMAGGFLYQHVNDHSMCKHTIETSEGDKFIVSGDHHQMFGYPLIKNSKLLAWASPRLSSVYEFGNGSSNSESSVEPEAVFYPKINSLAVQYHPEWMAKDSKGVVYYQALLRKYFK